MTVKELIQKLQQLPPDADVMIEEKNDGCDICAELPLRIKCSCAGIWHWNLEEPYLHEASNEVRLRGY